jgi:hypothetical protein
LTREISLTSQPEPKQNYKFVNWELLKEATFNVSHSGSSLYPSENRIFINNREAPTLTLVRDSPIILNVICKTMRHSIYPQPEMTQKIQSLNPALRTINLHRENLPFSFLKMLQAYSIIMFPAQIIPAMK